MELLTIIYLSYSFIAFYFLFFFILIYIPNRKKIFSNPKVTKEYSLSIVVPCYNKEKNIGKTLKALLNSDYKGLKKIIVVDDCSTDGSYKVIKKFAEKYSKVILVKTPKNTGKASGAKNYGARFVDTELIGFVDADSYPERDAIKEMIGFFDDKKIAAVTPKILVEKKENFIEKLQAIEYKVIAFTRKLLGFVDAIYVTPGPLAIYRKDIFDKIRGFDENNLTEDIEITWHIIAEGYKAQMSINSEVPTTTPDNFKDWFNQRIRWNIGGFQTINKYKKSFLKLGMLGSFILPFFLFSWFLGIFGFFVLIHRIFRRIIFQYLSTAYSIQAQTVVLSLREINLSINVVTFFGLVILAFSLFFTAISLKYSKEKEFKKYGLLEILVYISVYLLTYPIILIFSIFKLLMRKYSW